MVVDVGAKRLVVVLRCVNLSELLECSLGLYSIVRGSMVGLRTHRRSMAEGRVAVALLRVSCRWAVVVCCVRVWVGAGME